MGVLGFFIFFSTSPSSPSQVIDVVSFVDEGLPYVITQKTPPESLTEALFKPAPKPRTTVRAKMKNETATSNNLALISTLISDTKGRSSATLFDPNFDSSEIVREQDRLQNYPEIIVIRIDANEIELTNKRYSWTLQIESQAPNRITSAATEFNQILGSQSSLKTNEKVVALLKVNEGQRSYDNILSEATFAPYIQSGKQAGLHLSNIHPNGFYDRLGFSQGDILLEVNGMRVDGADAMNDIMSTFLEESSFELLVKEGDIVQYRHVHMAPSV